MKRSEIQDEVAIDLQNTSIHYIHFWNRVIVLYYYHIFQTEAPLLIRPLIPDMSPSELHAVMTGGFATIAGSVMASFILFGVSKHGLRVDGLLIYTF